MNSTYIWGVKNIADFFGLDHYTAFRLVTKGGIPGVRKLKRAWTDTHNGGGRGVWVLRQDLAKRYAGMRANTPAYDPKRATEALLNKYVDSGAENIPELIEMGLIDDTDWCNALNAERAKSYMHVPILMHPFDLKRWLSSAKNVHDRPVLSNTEHIFKKVRRSKHGTR